MSFFQEIGRKCWPNQNSPRSKTIWREALTRRILISERMIWSCRRTDISSVKGTRFPCGSSMSCELDWISGIGKLNVILKGGLYLSHFVSLRTVWKGSCPRRATQVKHISSLVCCVILMVESRCPGGYCCWLLPIKWLWWTGEIQQWLQLRLPARCICWFGVWKRCWLPSRWYSHERCWQCNEPPWNDSSWSTLTWLTLAQSQFCEWRGLLARWHAFEQGRQCDEPSREHPARSSFPWFTIAWVCLCSQCRLLCGWHTCG